MADCSDVFTEERASEQVDVSVESDDFYHRPVCEKVRAKSAKDLVKSQEHLITMLQKMKSDLSKMDREARHIKEDVVRSNQLFNVMVHLKQAHHLTPSIEGYNLSYSLPKVTYSAYKRPSVETQFRHLNQLSTFHPLSTSSGRTSVSSQSSWSHRLDHSEHSRRHFRRNSSNSRRAGGASTTEDSGTESEYDTRNSSRSRSSAISNISNDSSESLTEDAGSSPESISTSGRRTPDSRMLNENRRPSYFFTQSKPRSVAESSDGIDV